MTTLFLDIETTLGHPNHDGLLLAGFAVDDEPVAVLDKPDIDMGLGEDYERFVTLLGDPAVTKVTQTKYDLRYLMLSGFVVAGHLHDTAVAAHVLNENTPLDIDWLSWKYAGIDMDKRLSRRGGHVYFRCDDDDEHDLDDWKAWSGWPMEYGATKCWLQFIDYNARDVDALRKLYHAEMQRLEESEWYEPYVNERVPYTDTLLRMETRGLPVNIPAVHELAAEYQVEHDRLAIELREEGGLPPSFNLNSGDQLAVYLFSRVATFNDALVLGVDEVACIKSCLDGEHDDCEQTAPWMGAFDLHCVDMLPEGFVLDKLGRDRVHGHWTVKGRGLKPTPPTKNILTGELGKRPSTASPELLYMHAGDEWVKKLCLEYRKLEKLLTTYLTKWPVEAVNGRLYGRFNQTGTVTGRLSSSGPNLQNVPARGPRGKACRSLFEAPEGKLLVVGDYDQLEMRLMAHFSEDRNMLDIFRTGRDPHYITAQGIFGDTIDPDGEERGIGKTLNFAMGYGAGPRKVAQVLSLAGYPTTKEVAEGYLAEMSRFYRGFFRWKKGVMERAKRKGNVGTIGGGRRRLKANFRDTANWKLVGYGERQAVNAIIQGSAADILRRVMVLVDAECGWFEMLAQVHDELVGEADVAVFTKFIEKGPFYGYDLVDSTPIPGGEQLHQLQHIAEHGHGFDLRVPLLFEPHVGRTWAAAKEGPDLSELFEEVDLG